MSSFTIERTFRCGSEAKGRKTLQEPAALAATAAPGALPRVAKLMALAHHFESLLKAGVIENQAKLAAAGQVTRARISQIMVLLNLAPDIQETLLFLPAKQSGRDQVVLRDVLPIALECHWQRQREMWNALVDDACRAPGS